MRRLIQLMLIRLLLWSGVSEVHTVTYASQPYDPNDRRVIR